MTVVAPNPSQPKGFRDGVKWRSSLGGVPLARIVFDPWPGFATEADLIQIVEGHSRFPCELINGTLVEKCVGNYEDYIAALLVTHLNLFVMPRKLGFVFGSKMMARTQPQRVRLPDAAFVRRARLKGKPEKWTAIFAGCPDLAIEVISPGNRKAEMTQKLEEYFAAGASLIWYVYPKQKRVYVYQSVNSDPLVVSIDGKLTGGNVLPGFELNVREIFRLPT